MKKLILILLIIFALSGCCKAKREYYKNYYFEVIHNDVVIDRICQQYHNKSYIETEKAENFIGGNAELKIFYYRKTNIPCQDCYHEGWGPVCTDIN